MRFRNENVNVPQRITTVKPLQFTANTLSTISFNNSAPQLQYKINDGQWIDYNTASVSITLNVGDVIKWKRKVSTVRTAPLGQFHMTGSLAASGNIMSLLDGDNFATMTDLTGWGSASAGIFSELFKECTSMTNNGLVLPATIIEELCYKSMFWGCTSITSAPELPATTLKNGCYRNMFEGCTSLLTAPELPATTLAYQCYRYMFYRCTSLSTAPELPATTLENGCYPYMFHSCSSLSYVKCMATNAQTSFTEYWMQNVSASGTFIKAAGSTWPSGVSGIPSGWTVVEE